MTPYALVAIFVAGVFAGGLPVRMYYEAKEDQRAKLEAESALAQEKENGRIVAGYADAIIGVSDWYRDHPVRVRIQGNEGSPSCAAPDLADIVLTIPGYEGNNSAGAVQLLPENNGTGAVAD